ncbi:hypothetical protein [Kineosporia sp. R_H_3]|uniref:hypothetical protein n=1 Tax=Kineosporia sp. R_H_3 TaxID=1961848 RepID=UPI000B4A7712|nr:hypothetical protein [Kineosporia sp. R_H_3]
MERDDLVLELGRLLVADDEVTNGPGWAYVVLVATVDDASTRMNGFSYGPDGPPEPAAPRDPRTLDVVRDLRAAMAAHDGGPPWVSCLVRVERATGRLTVDVEHDDPQRWRITPQNRHERAAELDPRRA